MQGAVAALLAWDAGMPCSRPERGHVGWLARLCSCPLPVPWDGIAWAGTSHPALTQPPAPHCGAGGCGARPEGRARGPAGLPAPSTPSPCWQRGSRGWDHPQASQAGQTIFTVEKSQLVFKGGERQSVKAPVSSELWAIPIGAFVDIFYL